MMPRLDGFGLLRALRADPRTRDVPVILLSARAGEESRVEGLEAGADDYLVKPFSARELIARVAPTSSSLGCAERLRWKCRTPTSGSRRRSRRADDRVDWDFTSGIVSRSRTAPQFLGLAVQGVARAFYDLVEPDDRPLVESRIAAAITHGAPYEAEFRVRMPDGETRWLGNAGECAATAMAGPSVSSGSRSTSPSASRSRRRFGAARPACSTIWPP